MSPAAALTKEEKTGLVLDYDRRGFQLVFYPHRTKGPIGADAKGWPTRAANGEYAASTFDADRHNVGALLGTELADGGYLCDVDFDWPEGVDLARELLPEAGFGFGRGARRITHALYAIPRPLASRSFIDIDDQTLVEFRCLKEDGTTGLQTMLPPSIHPNGEELVVTLGEPLTHSPHVYGRVLLYAIGCLWLRRLGTHDWFQHKHRLAFVGFLMKSGLDATDVLLLGRALCKITGNNEGDLETVVNSTSDRMRRGDRHIAGSEWITKEVDKGAQIVARIRQWLSEHDFVRRGKDKPVANDIGNIKKVLVKLGISCARDTFIGRDGVIWDGVQDVGDSLRQVLTGNEWHVYDDDVITALRAKMPDLLESSPSVDALTVAVRDEALRHQFHPIREWLAGLAWDGVPRIEEWLISYGGATDSPYVRAVSAIVLMAAVRRVRRPGSKYDELLVLESAQGLLKSSALRALCPKTAWFSDDLPLNVDSKQTIERTAGKWIVEAAELSGMHRSQVEQLKSTLSRQVDGPVRMAYAHEPIERPRQFIIVGTTNSHMYLKDKTGNRRFWPVRVSRFDIAGLVAVREQLWAEAAQREAQGDDDVTRLHPQYWKAAEDEQKKRAYDDTWVTRLTEVFGDDRFAYFMTADDLFDCLSIDGERRDETALERLAKAMQSPELRFEPKRTRVAVKDMVREMRAVGLLRGDEDATPNGNESRRVAEEWTRTGQPPAWLTTRVPAIVKQLAHQSGSLDTEVMRTMVETEIAEIRKLYREQLAWEKAHPGKRAPQYPGWYRAAGTLQHEEEP